MFPSRDTLPDLQFFLLSPFSTWVKRRGSQPLQDRKLLVFRPAFSPTALKEPCRPHICNLLEAALSPFPCRKHARFLGLSSCARFVSV